MKPERQSPLMSYSRETLFSTVLQATEDIRTSAMWQYTSEMEDKIHLLYQQILYATKNGHDAEVRRDKDGNFVVYSVKKQRADKIQVK